MEANNEEEKANNLDEKPEEKPNNQEVPKPKIQYSYMGTPEVPVNEEDEVKIVIKIKRN